MNGGIMRYLMGENPLANLSFIAYDEQAKSERFANKLRGSNS